MRNIFGLFAFLLAVSLFSAQPTRAQFAACSGDLIASSFQLRYPDGSGGETTWTPPEVECVEFFRIAVATPRGERWIRGVGDINAPALLGAGAIQSVEYGVRRAVARFADLGDYGLDNTTIFIATDMPPTVGDSSAWGWAVEGQGMTGGECMVTLPFFSHISVADRIPMVVVHELFHCVQWGTLTREQMLSDGGWWREGSAELFGAVALPELGDIKRAGPRFEAAVAAGTPLYEMSYELAPLYFWRFGEEGLGWLMPMLRSMPADSSPEAQRAAMRANFSDDALRAFTRAYEDRRVRHPGGDPLDFGARRDGDVWDINGSSTHRRALAPFVIVVGWADYECGRWRNLLSYNAVDAHPESSAAWAAWPADYDLSARGGERLRYVAIHTGDEEAELTLETTRTQTCTACLTRTTIDRCLIGTWRLTAGGPMEWMRSIGIPMTRANMSEMTITLNEDGTMTGSGFQFDFMVTYPQDTGGGSGETAPTTGRWAAEGGRVYGCFDSGGEGAGVGWTDSGSAPQVFGGVAGEEGSSTYSCNDTTLETSAPMPRGGPMTHTFTRQTPRVRD